MSRRNRLSNKATFTMPSHRVQQGDCLAGIAKRYGLDWKTIWEHAENEALRELRKNPNVLHPGDPVFIPDKQLKWEQAATGATHRFKVNRPRTKIRLRLLEKEKPLVNAPYTLSVDGTELEPGVEKKTDAEGRLEAEVDLDAKEAHVKLPEQGKLYVLKLGHLDPITEVTGLQARLRQLGYYPGAVDGDYGEYTALAVWGFQLSQGLAPTGEADSATLSALEKSYGM